MSARTTHRLLKKRRGQMIDGVEIVAHTPGRNRFTSFGIGRRVDNLDAASFSESAHGLRKTHALDLHHEVDGTAALLAAKAMVDATLGIDGKARGLFLVKRTQTLKRSPLSRKAHGFSDEGHEIGALFD